MKLTGLVERPIAIAGSTSTEVVKVLIAHCVWERKVSEKSYR